MNIYILLCVYIYLYIYSIHTYNQPISRLFHWNPACDPCFPSQLTCAGGLGGLATRMTCRLIKIESNPWRNRLFGHVDSIDYLRFIWACRHAWLLPVCFFLPFQISTNCVLCSWCKSWKCWGLGETIGELWNGKSPSKNGHSHGKIVYMAVCQNLVPLLFTSK